MKKTVLICMLSASAALAGAQNPYLDALKTEEVADTAQIVTIADIVKLQEKVTSQHSTSTHFEKVWGYKSYFNISYLTSATLDYKGKYELGYPAINNNKIPNFKADYGVGLQLGHNYNLLKNPLANIVNINIDYTFIDLSLAHFSKEPGEFVYNSELTWKETDTETKRKNTRQYVPWALSKFDVNYGMTLGPSVTLAPFTSLNITQLDFLKFNIYYHIGYQLGVLWMVSDKDADASTKKDSYNYTDPTKLTWQHGLMQNFGFNVSWKTIGIGFETRWDNRRYKAFDTSTYGNKPYNFKGKSSRIYIKISY